MVRVRLSGQNSEALLTVLIDLNRMYHTSHVSNVQFNGSGFHITALLERRKEQKIVKGASIRR